MSNGEKGSNDYVNQKLEELVTKIESQFELFNINSIPVDKTCRAYLTMSEDAISRLSPEEIAMAEIKLSSYAFAIQKYVNTASAIKNWAERSIVSLIAKTYKDFDQMLKFEIRRELVIRNNEYAQRLAAVSNEQQVVIDEYAYLAQSVQHVSDAFGRLARIRRKE